MRHVCDASHAGQERGPDELVQVGMARERFAWSRRDPEAASGAMSHAVGGYRAGHAGRVRGSAECCRICTTCARAGRARGARVRWRTGSGSLDEVEGTPAQLPRAREGLRSPGDVPVGRSLPQQKSN